MEQHAKSGRPKGTPKPPAEFRSITPELAERLFSACSQYCSQPQKNEMWQLYLVILWQTGVRASEALAIQLSDIFPDKIRVIRLKRKRPAVDYVPIQHQLYELALAYAAKYQVRKQLFPVTYIGARWAFTVIRELAGISEDYTLHSFRHGFAYNYIRQSEDKSAELLTRLQRALGHSGLDTTGKYIRAGFDEVKGDIMRMRF